MTNFASTRETVRDGLGVIALRGEVDIYTAPKFKEDMLALIEEGAVDIVVDLSQVEFIDSTALGVLIGGIKRLHPFDGHLLLVANTRPVLKILTITGLDKVFAIFKTRAEALAAVA